jgi:hypothetical protein
MAFAALGKEMTGLPIDFQIYPESERLNPRDGPRVELA